MFVFQNIAGRTRGKKTEVDSGWEQRLSNNLDATLTGRVFGSVAELSSIYLRDGVLRKGDAPDDVRFRFYNNKLREMYTGKETGLRKTFENIVKSAEVWQHLPGLSMISDAFGPEAVRRYNALNPSSPKIELSEEEIARIRKGAHFVKDEYRFECANGTVRAYRRQNDKAYLVQQDDLVIISLTEKEKGIFREFFDIRRKGDKRAPAPENDARELFLSYAIDDFKTKPAMPGKKIDFSSLRIERAEIPLGERRKDIELTSETQGAQAIPAASAMQNAIAGAYGESAIATLTAGDSRAAKDAMEALAEGKTAEALNIATGGKLPELISATMGALYDHGEQKLRQNIMMARQAGRNVILSEGGAIKPLKLESPSIFYYGSLANKSGGGIGAALLVDNEPIMVKFDDKKLVYDNTASAYMKLHGWQKTGRISWQADVLIFGAMVNYLNVLGPEDKVQITVTDGLSKKTGKTIYGAGITLGPVFDIGSGIKLGAKSRFLTTSNIVDGGLKPTIKYSDTEIRISNNYMPGVNDIGLDAWARIGISGKINGYGFGAMLPAPGTGGRATTFVQYMNDANSGAQMAFGMRALVENSGKFGLSFDAIGVKKQGQPISPTIRLNLMF